MNKSTQSPVSPEAGTSEINAAAQAAGRGLFTGVLQSNPLVALGALLLSPILGLFKRRTQPANHVSKLKLETYRSMPVPAAANPPKWDNRVPSVLHRSYIGSPSVLQSTSKPGSRATLARRTVTRKGAE